MLSGDVGVGSRNDRGIYAVKMIATIDGAVVTAEMSATVPVSFVALSAVETSCIPQFHSGVNAARHGGRSAVPVLKAIDDGRYALRKRWAIDRQRRRRCRKQLAFVRRHMLGNGLTIHAQLSHLPRQERSQVTCAHEHTSAVRCKPAGRSPDAVHRPPPPPPAGSGTPPAAAGQSRPAAALRPARLADAACRSGHAARRSRPEPATCSTPTAAPRRRKPQSRARRAPPPVSSGGLQHAYRRHPPMSSARPGTPRAAAGQSRPAAARRPPVPAHAACRTLYAAPPPAGNRRPLRAEHRSASL